MSRRTAVKPNEYILVWTGDAPKTVTSHGQSIVVPARDEIADAKGVYRFASVRDADGKPVPGTVLLRDEIGTTPDGGQILQFDARAWVEMLELNNPMLFDTGFEVVDNLERVYEVVDGCRDKYETSRQLAAETVIRAELARQQRYEALGQPAPPPPNPAELVWARELRIAARARASKSTVQAPSTAELLDALGDNALPSPAPSASFVPAQEPTRRGPGRPRKITEPPQAGG